MTDTPAPTGAISADALEPVAAMTRRFGSDDAYVLAGGGNASLTDGDTLAITASGTPLANAQASDFVMVDRKALLALLDHPAMAGDDVTTAAFRPYLNTTRLDLTSADVPSIEGMMHAIMPGPVTLHTHSTVASALACSDHGKSICAELFGDTVAFVPFAMPGISAGRALQQAIAKKPVDAAILQNHGLIVAGDTADAVEARTKKIVDTIAKRLGDVPRSGDEGTGDAGDVSAQLRRLGPVLRGLLGCTCTGVLPCVTFDTSGAACAVAGDAQLAKSFVAGPITPHEIYYAGAAPLWLDHTVEPEGDDAAMIKLLGKLVTDHINQYLEPPRTIVVPGVGIAGVGPKRKDACDAIALFKDAACVRRAAAKLGKVVTIDQAGARQITAWHDTTPSPGRAAGKVAVVTGAAQGFGLEIAQHFAAQGGQVVLADLNEQGAIDAAKALCDEHGPGRATAVAINVADSGSVAAAIDKVVADFGGLDVFVSNAGVLKAGSVKTLPIADLDFVTKVNYTGYFVCVQQVAPILARQHQANPSYRSDIIQINSKSGLVGSNRNGAYAGSKFGGIGLTQSFALELVEDGIKVNSICPGNFFDGPLWSDPKRGLFVQYLNTGKVPGAKTIEDVKKFYEQKVPMGRGCRTADVMAAVFYLIDQPYETGQAVPVTGGQVMLS